MAVGSTQTFITTWRPWFSLYGVRLKSSNLGRKQVDEAELSLIQSLLPDELLLMVFERLPSYALGRTQCVCKQWQQLAATPRLWEAACIEAFVGSPPERNVELLQSQYSNCWRTMFLDRPHLRYDGLYVSRNTYLKQGIVEWETKHSVHLVVFFRYTRFFPDGTFLYRTSPDVPARAAKALLLAAPRGRGGVAGKAGGRQPREADNVYPGQWRLLDDRLYTALSYDNRSQTEIRSRLRLRSSVRGANNLLDILDLVSYDRADGSSTPMPGAPVPDAQDPTYDDSVERRTYSRGMTSYLFVPWEQLQSTQMNLPVSQLDYFIPG